MLYHHIKLALRNFGRNKGSFLINLCGLATGLACTLLIYLWVQDEMQFDKFHENDQQLFQVMQRLNKNKNDVLTWEASPGILGESLLEEIPEVEQAVQVSGIGAGGIIGLQDKKYKATELFISSDFFNVFSFKLIEGHQTSPFPNNQSVILTTALAEKLFGTTENLIGQNIDWERNWENITGTYTIAGICKTPPSHSTMQFEVLFPYDLYLKNKPDALEWRNSDPYTFITLKKNTDIDQFNSKIEHFIKRKIPTSSSTIFVRKYSDRYLYNNFENGIQSGGRISYVKLFSIIALFIIIIACINFMNLATAKSSKRLKEIGVKKTVGASRGSLVIQHLSESILLSFIGLLIALSLIGFILPHFNELTGKTLSIQFQPAIVMAFAGITLFTGLLAGSYPAFYLSGFKPIQIFQGILKKSRSEFWARKGLVVFQFTLSILLIVAVLVVQNQLQYIQNKNLGYNKDNVLVFKKDGTIKENIDPFLAELKNIPGVANASTYDGTMTGNYGYTTTIRWKGNESPENPIRFGVMIVGYDIIETMGMEVVAGRSFSKELDAQTARVVINEQAAKVIGYEDPIGKTIRQRQQEYTIVGVVKDFHYESLYDEVKPCIIKKGTYGNRIYVKIKSGAEQETIAHLETLYGKFNPGLPFEFSFIDEAYNQLYASEKRVASLSGYFAFMAILISCLGLLGLAAFTAERRSKEISIRKILGSSTLGIVRLLSGELTRLVAIAIFIAIPLSFLLADQWLDSFAFRTTLKPSVFIWAGLIALTVTGLTVGFQSIKAALVNPVHSLRND